MIARVLSAALAAGFLAACVAAALQFFLTTPLILRAETFEKHAAVEGTRPLLILAHGHGSEAPQDGAAAGDATEWQPADGLQRTVFTGLATLVTAVGYALLLIALMLAAGREPSLANATRWAVGGFLAVNLAPAIGLPPELPGMGGADLVARQAWWVCAVVGSAVGIYLLAAVRSPIAIMVGVAAIVLPHVIGAPHAEAAQSDVPALLAAQFAARSLAVAFVFWMTLGLAVAWSWAWFQRSGEPALAAR